MRMCAMMRRRKRQSDLAVVLGEYDLTKPDETRSQKFKVGGDRA